MQEGKEVPVKEHETSIRVIVERQLFDRLDKSIPWGVRSEVIRKLLSMTLDLTEKHGTMAIGAILDNHVEFITSTKTVSTLDTGEANESA